MKDSIIFALWGRLFLSNSQGGPPDPSDFTLAFPPKDSMIDMYMWPGYITYQSYTTHNKR